MGTVVRNLSRVNGRWKYRKVIPVKLRPHIDGNITEFVRWLDKAHGSQPGPDVLRKHADADAECASMLALAAKRAAGQFDELGIEAIAHIIAQARHELLEEDDEDRFDPAEGIIFDAVEAQLEASGAAINPFEDRRWIKRQEGLEDALTVWRHEYARGELSKFITDEVMDRCAARGLYVDGASLGFRRLAKTYLGLLIEVAEAGLERQEGKVVHAPEPPPQAPTVDLRETSNQTLTGLVEDWWREAEKVGRSLSTYEAYERVMRQFTAFLGHDDANAVTVDDVIRYKDHRLAQGKSLKTIKASDLSALSSLYKWGIGNRRVQSNPTDGVMVLSGKRPQTRDKALTDDEALAILRHASNYQKRERENQTTALAKRWLPWLMAYTGARVGEVAQLRGKDVRQEGDLWVMRLTPEAGTLKTAEYRDVPMHPHLVEMGLPAVARAAGDMHLFLNVTEPGAKGVRGALSTTKNDVREFVREVVTDPSVQPNHGWRHRVEAQGRDLEVRDDTTYSVTGRALRGSVKHYPSTSLKAKAGFVFKLPRYAIEGENQ